MSRDVIDLNSDVGEGFGRYRLGNDEEILKVVSSANIACGFHAGDPNVMMRTVELAKRYGVAIGAHPGLPDLLGFGRREMAVSPEEVYNLMVYQIGALAGMVSARQGRMHHVKPHGALYHMATKRPDIAQAIVAAVRDTDRHLVLFGLAGSLLCKEGEAAGLQVAHEVFADRTYQADGSLSPRTSEQALVATPELACQQVLRMLREQRVGTTLGTDIPIRAETVCVHGDHEQAVAFARALRSTLENSQISIANLGGRQAHV